MTLVRAKKVQIVKEVTWQCFVFLALSGSLWLSLALFGSVWLCLARCPALSGSLWLSLARCLALSGSLWLSLALSGFLRLSLALYCSPNLLTKPLLGSQGPCSARNVVPEFQHFLLVWGYLKCIIGKSQIFLCQLERSFLSSYYKIMKSETMHLLAPPGDIHTQSQTYLL